MNWYTASEDQPEEVQRLLAAWPEAPVENLEVLGMILGTARDQVLSYAPASAPPTVVDGYIVASPTPDRYVLAQLRQAQSIWDAGRVNTNGDIGDGGYVFTPRPMDKTIKAIIRPADGKPHVL
jgi:hypothetical protein